MRIFVSAVLAACTVYGQAGSLASPGAGFVFDPSAQVLRRIQGIPGAALVGDAVDFGFPLASATVAPRLDSAIVLASDGTAHLFRLSGATAQEVAMDSLLGNARTVYSPSGSAVALYSDERVQVLKGLPGAPVIAAAGIALHEGKYSPTFAISDDGAYLLYARGGPVEVMGVLGDSRKLMNATPGSLLAFAPAGHDAAVVHGGTLYLYRDVAGASTVRSYPGLTSPTAIAFSPDARKLFIASARGRSVMTVDVPTGATTSMACDCAPTSMIPMGSFMRLNELSSEPLWLLDTTSDRPLIFVPARATN
jgi:hypothetical protein